MSYHFGVALAAFPAVSGTFSSYWPRLNAIFIEHGYSMAKHGYGLDQQQPVPVHLPDFLLRKITQEISFELLNKAGEPRIGWQPTYLDANDPFEQACLVLSWYGSMIGTKVERLLGMGEEEFGEVIEDHPDHLPTAKIAVIIIVRAIAAATVVMEMRPELAKQLLPIVEKMARVLNVLRTRAPQAYMVRLPGFDDPAYEAELESFYQGFPPINPFQDNSWSAGERAPAE